MVLPKTAISPFPGWYSRVRSRSCGRWRAGEVLRAWTSRPPTRTCRPHLDQHEPPRSKACSPSPARGNELTGAVSPLVIAPSTLANFFRLRQTPSPPGIPYRYVAPMFTTGSRSVRLRLHVAGKPQQPAAGGSAQDNGLGSVLLHTGELTPGRGGPKIPGRGFNWRFGAALIAAA